MLSEVSAVKDPFNGEWQRYMQLWTILNGVVPGGALEFKRFNRDLMMPSCDGSTTFALRSYTLTLSYPWDVLDTQGNGKLSQDFCKPARSDSKPQVIIHGADLVAVKSGIQS